MHFQLLLRVVRSLAAAKGTVSVRATAGLLLLGLTCAVVPARAADWLYLTVQGDTLIGLGQQYLKNPNDWPKIQSVNKVPIPKHMPTRFQLRFPVELLKVTPAPVTVSSVSGNVRYKMADGHFQPLNAEEKLAGGTTVLTGPRSSVSYRFADGTELTQQASSKLTFSRLAAYGKTGMVATELTLDNGRLEAHASKQFAPAGGFSVRTPTAVAGLRGTAFRLNAGDDGQRLTNEVTQGAVAVSAQGEEVGVAAGFGTFAEAGKPPAPPVVLLPAPDLKGLATQVSSLPLQFTWAGVEGAKSWRAQVASDTGFNRVLLDDTFKTSLASWPEGLPDGQYVLRVRAIDENGLEGLDGTHAFTLDARPLPPSLNAPAEQASQTVRQVDFAWEEVAEARGYVLQIAPTTDFTTGLQSKRLDKSRHREEKLPLGDWYWRVASVDDSGQPHLFSPARRLNIKAPPAPAAPENFEVSLGDKQVHMNWTGSAKRYRVEISTGESFANPVNWAETSDTHIDLPAPLSGVYWVRVLALGDDKTLSPPSRSKEFSAASYTPPRWMMLLLPLLGL